jgi:hypothetical protein
MYEQLHGEKATLKEIEGMERGKTVYKKKIKNK